MNASSVDEKAVAARVKAVSDLEASSLKARTDQRLAMRRLLTPEQQEKMKQLMRRGRMERSGARREHRQDRPGWPGQRPGPGGPWSDEVEDLPEPER